MSAIDKNDSEFVWLDEIWPTIATLIPPNTDRLNVALEVVSRDDCRVLRFNAITDAVVWRLKISVDASDLGVAEFQQLPGFNEWNLAEFFDAEN